MKMIEMQDVRKKFGSVTALNGINLNVGQGEVHGFIGPNGAGKTTTIRVLMGILKATSGSATIFGQDVWKNSVNIHKRIAYVPGDVNLWSNLTGGEVIDLFLRLRGHKNAKYQKDLIEQFDFDPRKKCRTYSKGNRQKVALVAAFASDADLFIFDEPTSGLDPLMENVFKENVQKMTKAGKSILLSSHILSEVEELCNKVSIIRQGKIIETGTLAELRHLTRTAITATTKESLADLQKFPYIYDLNAKGEATSFTTDTEKLSEVITYLNSKGLLDLKCMPPSLEELFMSHYAEGGR